MKTSGDYIDQIFEFEGQWGIPSKCGLKIINNDNGSQIYVTELYKDNPGSSVTSVAASLANQICDRYRLDPTRITYIECNPDMNSKLSFYKQQFFRVTFDIVEGRYSNPRWEKINQK